MYTLTRSCAPDQEQQWEEVKLEEEEMKVEQYDDEEYDPWDESWWHDTEEEVAEEPAIDIEEEVAEEPAVDIEEEVAEEPAVYQAWSIGVSNIHHSKLNMAIWLYVYIPIVGMLTQYIRVFKKM